jgi:hypothetical protein
VARHVRTWQRGSIRLPACSDDPEGRMRTIEGLVIMSGTTPAPSPSGISRKLTGPIVAPCNHLRQHDQFNSFICCSVCSPLSVC